jgi:acetoin utilization deacetylase AcuC-like enzyme
MQFRPEMIFVSVGYDAHFSDPLTTLTLDTCGYHEITRRLVELANVHCNGRIMFVLEGGYDPLALRDNIQASLAAMCGRSDFPDHYGPAPDPSADVSHLVQTITDLHHL